MARDCSEHYISGIKVTLTEILDSNAFFQNWSGVYSGSNDTCIVIMDAEKNITANFKPNTYTLILTKAGTGNGTVTSNPIMMNCGTICYVIPSA